MADECINGDRHCIFENDNAISSFPSQPLLNQHICFRISRHYRSFLDDGSPILHNILSTDDAPNVSHHEPLHVY